MANNQTPKKLQHAIATMQRVPTVPFCPFEPTDKQLELLTDDRYEVLFGGAAGPGKSSALLMAALQYVHCPDYAALIIRKTYADLARPGALMDMAHRWLAGSAAKWNSIKKEWTFPSGAKIVFGYLASPGDEYQYQGSQIQTLIVDELTQIDHKQYLYLTTRIRRDATSNVPLRIRCASNPGGIGMAWVHARFLLAHNERRGFISARIEDNPHLDAESYRQTFLELDDITRRQLLYGEWISDAANQVYKFDQIRNTVQALPELKHPKEWKYVLGIDLGASQKEASTSFVVVAFEESTAASYVVYSEKFAGMYPATIGEHILKIYKQFGRINTVIDEGALGKGYGEEFRRRFHIATKPAEKSDKLGYRRLINGAFERGELMLIDSATKELQAELKELIWDDKGLDVAKGQACHMCISGDALIRTYRAEIAIKDLVVGDMVLTRQGYFEVLAHASSGVRPVFLIETMGGRTIKATGNHPIYVDGKGWTRTDELLYGYRILCLNEYALNSTEQGITDIQNPQIEQPESIMLHLGGAVSDCIERFGEVTLGKSQKGITSITKMETRKTIPSKTLSVLPWQSISAITEKAKNTLRKLKSISQPLEMRPGNGTLLTKAANGTRSTHLNPGPEKREFSHMNVVCAGRSLKPEHQEQQSAQINVMPKRDATQESMTKQENANGAPKISCATNTVSNLFVVDHVIRVTPMPPEEVFDITVDHVHEFFANGILVKNSDGLLYAWRESRSWMSHLTPKPGPKYGSKEWYVHEERKMLEQLMKENKSTEPEFWGEK